MRHLFRLAGALLVSALSLPAAWAADCVNETATIPFSTPTSDFTLNPDGTATHHQTGLIWDRCAFGQTGADCSGGAVGALAWKVALQSVAAENSNSYKGHNDWRMPNIKELLSIRELRCFNPHINTTVFPNAPNANYWTSTVLAHGATSAWVVESPGFTNSASKEFNQYSLRMVRGGGVYGSFNAQFPLLLLSVNKAGNGGGTVTDTSGPCTLDDSGNCLLDSGSSITLHAEADPDSVFVGWSAAAGSVPDTCDDTVADCQVITIAANGSVTAIFQSRLIFENSFEIVFAPAQSAPFFGRLPTFPPLR